MTVSQLSVFDSLFSASAWTPASPPCHPRRDPGPLYPRRAASWPSPGRGGGSETLEEQRERTRREPTGFFQQLRHVSATSSIFKPAPIPPPFRRYIKSVTFANVFCVPIPVRVWPIVLPLVRWLAVILVDLNVKILCEGI